jgi:hypothetical protein
LFAAFTLKLIIVQPCSLLLYILAVWGGYVQDVSIPDKIDERGTLKATEHDKYENIAGLV